MSTRETELKEYASGVDTSPRRTGFSPIYRTQLINFSSVETWLSLKLRIHVVLAFQAKREAALNELHSLFQRDFRSRRNHSVKMVRHDDERLQEKPSLIAIVKKSSLKQLRRGCDLKKAATFSCHGRNQIRPGFLRCEPHLSNINQMPASKAAAIASLRSGA